MSKKTNVPAEYDEMNIDSFLDNFEKNGAAISSPVLPEGNYRANLQNFNIRYGITIPTKGDNAGKEIVWALWGMKLALDSVEAQALMKRDGDVNVYADNDTTNLRRGNIELGPMGISPNNNAGFWGMVGSILEQVQLAEVFKDDSGSVEYKINREVLNVIYKDVREKLPELQADNELDPRLIPCKLAELQMQRLTEFLTGEPETRFMYVHISRRAKYNDKSAQEHFVKQIMLKNVFEENSSNLDTVVA